MEAFEKGDYKTALQRLSRAIELNKEFSQAYYYRGRVYDEVPWLGSATSPVPAIEEYDSAIKYNPKYAEAYFRRGTASWSDQDKIECLNMAIQLKPDFTEAYYARGLARSEMGVAEKASSYVQSVLGGVIKEGSPLYVNLETAGDKYLTVYMSAMFRFSITDFTSVIKLEPNHAQAYYELGVARFKLEEYREAVEAFSQAIRISPDNGEAHYLRGLAHVNLKDYPKAAEDFTETMRLKPNDSAAYDQRAVVRFVLEDYDGALEDYVKGLRVEPEQSPKPQVLYTAGGRTFIKADFTINPALHFEAVLSELKKYTPNTIKVADAFYQRGLAKQYVRYSGRDEREKAVADFTQAILLNPALTDAYYQRGLDRIQSGAHADAIRDFTVVIRLNPQNVEAYFNRGQAYYQAGDKPAAIADFSQAIKLKPDFTNTYYQRGRAYYYSGNAEQALLDLEQAIKNYPDLPEAYYYRGLAYELAGRQEKAIADYIQVAHLTSPDEDVKRINQDRLNLGVATTYYRGVARLHLALKVDVSDFDNLNKTQVLDYIDYLKAFKDFTEVIVANPKLAEAYYQRGRAFQLAGLITSEGGEVVGRVGGDIRGALSDFAEAIRLNPGFVEVYLAGAKLYASNRQPQPAIAELTTVIALRPKEAQSYYRRGLLHAGQRSRVDEHPELSENPAAALADYTAATTYDPKFIQAYLNRAVLLQKYKKDLSGALNDYTTVIGLDPENVPAYRGRGDIRMALKDYPGALQDYTRAIELNPSEPGSYDFDSAITYVHRGMALYELGDGKRARQDFSQALLIRPCLTCAGGSVTASQANKAEGFLRKGLALLRRGDKTGSKENLEKAATLFYADGDMPKYQNVKYQLSRF
ncbi:MAG TPA: hypothetical protein DC054_21885 [Blastocatellia bacterium]|nr:hypothetical protein [Blastocatellia bacterium]